MSNKDQALWLAFYESRNFSFFATGPTSYTAHSALVQGLKDHGTQYQCEPNWWYADDIYVMKSSVGECLRDRAPIKCGGK
jgi:hypothetical protein